jgi:hypothetical protein
MAQYTCIPGRVKEPMYCIYFTLLAGPRGKSSNFGLYGVRDAEPQPEGPRIFPLHTRHGLRQA